jgi:hypothetical protein
MVIANHVNRHIGRRLRARRPQLWRPALDHKARRSGLEPPLASLTTRQARITCPMAKIYHITSDHAKLHAKLEADATRRSPVYCPAVELDALEAEATDAADAAGRAGDSDLEQKLRDMHDRLREMSTRIVPRSLEGMAVEIVELDIKLDDIFDGMADAIKAAGYELEMRAVKRLAENLRAGAAALIDPSEPAGPNALTARHPR